MDWNDQLRERKPVGAEKEVDRDSSSNRQQARKQVTTKPCR